MYGLNPSPRSFFLISATTSSSGFSISTKLVTILLVPIWSVVVAWPLSLADKLRQQLTTQVQRISEQTGEIFTWHSFWPLMASLALFVPLFTARSQQFNPWYWCWILVWLPLIRVTWWRQVIIAFSLSSMLRYLPWLLQGGYTDTVQMQQRLITWGIPLIWLLVFRGYEHYRYRLQK